MALGAIILTGGASSRMGVDKAAMDWNGRRAVDRLADLAGRLGAAAAVTSGRGAYGLPAVSEDPPGGGPAAGVLAAAGLLRRDCDRLLVLAVDAPTLLAEDLSRLLAAPSPGACFEDLNLPLVAWVAHLPSEAGAGRSLRWLIEAAGLARLPCPPAAHERLRGANTPAERDLLLAALVAAESAGGGGAG